MLRGRYKGGATLSIFCWACGWPLCGGIWIDCWCLHYEKRCSRNNRKHLVFLCDVL